MSEEKPPFEWQLKQLAPLTQFTLDNLSFKVDHFGQPFGVGDIVLQVVLMNKTNCCGFKNELVQLHPQSIPQLESKFRYYLTKMGIPRYVLRTL